MHRHNVQRGILTLGPKSLARFMALETGSLALCNVHGQAYVENSLACLPAKTSSDTEDDEEQSQRCEHASTQVTIVFECV